MKSDKSGMIISKDKTEVTNISKHGFWLFHNGEEYFLAFKEFPWFRKANIEEITNVESPSESHLYWPGLDIDLHLDSIRNPEKFPLVSK